MAVVELERRGAIALITLNRPEARNAVSPEVSQTMAALLDEVEADDALRAVVITGRGEVFSAGAGPHDVARGRGHHNAGGQGGLGGGGARRLPPPTPPAGGGAP